MDPGHIGALVQLAESASSREFWGESVRRWERVLEVSKAGDLPLPKHALARLESARLAHAGELRRAGDFDEAEKVLTAVLSMDPGHIGALVQLAESASSREFWGESVRRWERVLEVSKAGDLPLPKQALARLESARLAYAGELRRTGDLNEAETLLFAVLSQKSAHFAALFEMAEVLVHKRQWDKALLCYHSLLGIERQRFSKVLEGMSIAFRETGNLRESQGISKGAALCGLGGRELLCQLMQSYIQEDKWKDLGELLLHILAIDPLAIASIEVSRLTLEVLEKTGLNDQAAFVLRESMSRLNESKPAFQSMAILREVERVVAGQRSYDADISCEYYDDIYALSPKYKLSAAESPYLPVWDEIIGKIKQEDYRSVLDLGCGPGQFAAYLMDQIPEVEYIGIDFSAVAIEEAKKRCPAVRFLLADLNSINTIKEFNFDVVLIMEVLEHVQNDLKILEKLPSQSNVIASVPNFDSYGHVRFFNNAKEVISRYCNVLLNIEVSPIKLKNKSIIFVIKGIVK